jgi:hypothetical protein
LTMTELIKELEALPKTASHVDAIDAIAPMFAQTPAWSGAWWGGYGMPPFDVHTATFLRVDEAFPMLELSCTYERCRDYLAQVAGAALERAGGDTRSPRWGEAWSDPKGLGRASWLITRWCAERMIWAA